MKRRLTSCTVTHLLAVACGLSLGFPAGIARAQEQEPQPIRPASYYAELRSETAQRIADQFARADLRAMGWYADVTETEEQITVCRETWSLTFDRRSAGISRATLRGRPLADGLNLADVVITDAEGKAYSRSRATDGSLTVREDKRHVYLDGAFTPTAADGQTLDLRLAIHYDIYKSCGFTTVKLEVLQGEAPVTSVKAIHTLGRTDKPLRFFQHSNNAVGSDDYVIGSLADARLIHYTDDVYFAMKFGSALWSNGEIGMSAIPLPETYLNAPPAGGVPDTFIPQPGRSPDSAATDPSDPRYSPDRLMEVAVREQASHLDFVFIRRDEPTTLQAGYETRWSFSLLPFRRLRPLAVTYSDIFSAPAGEMPQTYIARHETPQQMRELVRQAAAAGVTLATPYQYPASDLKGMGLLAPDDAVTAWARGLTELIQPFNISPQYAFIFFTGVWSSTMQRDPLLTADELRTLRDHAAADDTDDNIRCDTNAPAYRDYVLRGTTLLAKEVGARGVYFDLCYVYSPLPGNPSQVEGNVRLLEDLRLLLDSFSPSGTIVWHSGGQITPAESLATFTLPGEPIEGAGFRSLTPGQQAIAYNATLIGSNVIPYKLSETHRTDLPNLWHQVLAEGISGLTLRWKDGQPMQLHPNVHRYLSPMNIFDVNRSELHHWADSDISQFVQTVDVPYRVNVYTRPNEALLAVTLDSQQHEPGKLRLNPRSLNLTTDYVLVFDTVHKTTNILPVTDDMTLDVPALDDGPVIYYLRGLQDLATPGIFWRDPRIEVLDCQPMAEGGAVNQQQLQCTVRMKAVGPGGAKAKLYLYRGDFGPMLSNNFSPVWQVDDEPDARVSVLEVRLPPDSGVEPYQTHKLGISFMKPAPGWE